MLRHQDRNEEAQRLVSSAASGVEATGLGNRASVSAYTQMLCTLAYTAAWGGQRAEALAMTEEARRAARRLPPPTAPAGRLFNISPAAVDLYAVGIHWGTRRRGRRAGGREGPAAHTVPRLPSGRHGWAPTWRGPIGLGLRPEQQPARALLTAYRSSPAEVRDRPAIRSIVYGLAERYPRATGVRELHAAVRQQAAWKTA